MRLQTSPLFPPTASHWSRLVSPEVDVTRPSCLALLYLASNVHYLIYRRLGVSRTEMLRIDHHKQPVAWHPVAMTIPAGRYSIVIEATFEGKVAASDFNGIANIIFRPGSCEHVTAGEKQLCY